MSETEIHTKESLESAGILPEAIQTELDVEEWLSKNPEKTGTAYGHGIGMLGQIIVTGENMPLEEQRADLKRKAEYLVKKYGDHIVEFMRPELREALGLQALEEEAK